MQLKEIILDEIQTDNGVREAQEQVENGEEVLNPNNTCSGLNVVLNAINNKFKHEGLVRKSEC